MLFEIKGANLPIGINPRICSFAIEFPESTLGSEARIKLVVGFDENKMLSQVTVSEVG